MSGTGSAITLGQPAHRSGENTSCAQEQGGAEPTRDLRLSRTTCNLNVMSDLQVKLSSFTLELCVHLAQFSGKMKEIWRAGEEPTDLQQCVCVLPPCLTPPGRQKLGSLLYIHLSNLMQVILLANSNPELYKEESRGKCSSSLAKLTLSKAKYPTWRKRS